MDQTRYLTGRTGSSLRHGAIDFDRPGDEDGGEAGHLRASSALRASSGCAAYHSSFAVITSAFFM